MSTESVKSEDTVKEWYENPSKLLAFIQNLIWKARIDPSHALIWRTSEGKIEIFDIDAWKKESEGDPESGGGRRTG